MATFSAVIRFSLVVLVCSALVTSSAAAKLEGTKKGPPAADGTKKTSPTGKPEASVLSADRFVLPDAAKSANVLTPSEPDVPPCLAYTSISCV
jgi:hypothetical protein